MPRNTDITIPLATWTQITDANVTSITFQNKGTFFVIVKGTTDTTAPTDENGSIRYNPGQGERNVPLSDLFPGVAAVRVWAYSPGGTSMMVSHS